ncbi:MAG: hypothetical protein LVQ75_04935 [Candidatus Babeliales bacterium]|jgi:hypothetical protein
MKKLLLLVVLLQFGQIFTAAEGGPYKGGPGKRSAPSGAEPAAQRRRVDLQLLPFDSAAFIEIAGSCQYCGEAFQGQAELSEHKCEKKILDTLVVFVVVILLFLQIKNLSTIATVIIRI